MDNKSQKSWYVILNVWLPNLSYLGVIITLFIIMVQVFYARRTMVETSEWEKAKVTIENIKQFKENLTTTELYGKTEALRLSSDELWPDFSTPENFMFSDTLLKMYWSFFDDDQMKGVEDFEKTLAILNDFAYPIIMGYASEIGSFQSVMKDYYAYCNFIMPYTFREYVNIGHYAKLLYRLWRVRIEQVTFENPQRFFEVLEKGELFNSENITDCMLCFEEPKLPRLL